MNQAIKWVVTTRAEGSPLSNAFACAPARARIVGLRCSPRGWIILERWAQIVRDREDGKDRVPYVRVLLLACENRLSGNWDLTLVAVFALALSGYTKPQSPAAASLKTQAPGAQNLTPSATFASNAAAIPGRLSSEQIKAILAQAIEENRRAFSDLVQQTSALPRALLLMQQSGPQYDDKGL